MTSTTASKKEIVDFLWEWAEKHSDWGKLLIGKIVTTENSLSIADREEIFSCFLQSINENPDSQNVIVEKPSYAPTSKTVELISLSNITGVNRLATDQILSFSKNITVIYGENGTGKTGYSRILKSLGFSYDDNNTIHSNIFNSEDNSKSAVIDFRVNGCESKFNWCGGDKDTELQNISVFNNSCVVLSLSNRQLIVSPIGFHLFDLVTKELNLLDTRLKEEISSYKVSIDWLENLNNGSPQKTFISGLSESSSKDELIRLSSFSSEQEQELLGKQAELGRLNKTLIQNEIQTIVLQENELEDLLEKIKANQLVLNDSNFDLLKSYNKNLSILENKEKIGIKEVAEKNGIEFYEKDEFKEFIKSADDYIKILNKSSYPNSDDLCVYCKQPLETAAIDLLRSYRLLLNDTTQDEIESLKACKAKLINSVSVVNACFVFKQATFGFDVDKKAIQPDEIISYNNYYKKLKDLFLSDNHDNYLKDSFDYTGFFSMKKTEISSDIANKTETLKNIPAKEIELERAINELKDRKLLSGKIDEVVTCIENKKTVSKLNKESSNFSSHSISRKTTDARNHLVERNFKQLFENELRSLRKSNLEIVFSFETDRGRSSIKPSIGGYKLTEVLSEGEQKTIALAEFLTELQLDNIKAPVIFDDPVNSLDHKIIDEVCKRLIELSKERQVIVFSHSILLLNSIKQQSELPPNKNIQFKFHEVKSNFNTTGLLGEFEGINSYSFYTSKLDAVLKEKPNGLEEELAAKGYGHLRSAIEVSVEDDVLQKTIKRYKRGVAVPALLRIDGNTLDTNKLKLNDIYEKCCVSIDGHSDPMELPRTPTLAELRIDYDAFKKIRKLFV
jgi:recombinational DNA repair ATPase RecF